jgi:hypothetical protein
MYVGLLLWAAMPQGTATQLMVWPPPSPCPSSGPCEGRVLTPLSTNADIRNFDPTCDAAFVATRAKGIVEHRDWGHISGWPFWPPGMVALQTFCYWLSPALPVALVLIVLGCALWAAVLTQAAWYCAYCGLGRLQSLLLPLVLLLSGEFTYYFHMGVFYSESYSTAPFLLGIGLLLRAARAHSVRVAIWAGVCLAASAYMRGQTDLVMTVTAAAFAGYVLWRLAVQEKSWRYGALKQLFHASAGVAVLAVALTSYYAVTFPYRVAHRMQWITISDSPMWPPTWERKEAMVPMLRFYITGGGVEGCAIDPALCGFIHAQRAAKGDTVFSNADYFHFTVQSFVHHPLRWCVVKAPYLYDFWMENPGEAVTLVFLFPVLLYACLARRDAPHILLALLLVTTCIGIIFPLLLTHFEARYLYQFRLLILYAAVMAIAGNHARNATQKR